MDRRLSYKSLPIEERVEIAYGTVLGYEGKGHATSLAAALVRVARLHGDSLIIVPQTLPEQNASGSVLKKLGFEMIRKVDHPEDGLVWEWEFQANVLLRGSEWS